jgi:hypothetical protein
MRPMCGPVPGFLLPGWPSNFHLQWTYWFFLAQKSSAASCVSFCACCRSIELKLLPSLGTLWRSLEIGTAQNSKRVPKKILTHLTGFSSFVVEGFPIRFDGLLAKVGFTLRHTVQQGHASHPLTAASDYLSWSDLAETHLFWITFMYGLHLFVKTGGKQCVLLLLKFLALLFVPSWR